MHYIRIRYWTIESVNDKYKSSDELVDVVVSAASVITVEDGLDVITIEDGFGSLETDNFLKYDNKFGIFYLLLDRLYRHRDERVFFVSTNAFFVISFHWINLSPKFGSIKLVIMYCK